MPKAASAAVLRHPNRDNQLASSEIFILGVIFWIRFHKGALEDHGERFFGKWGSITIRTSFLKERSLRGFQLLRLHDLWTSQRCLSVQDLTTAKKTWKEKWSVATARESFPYYSRSILLIACIWHQCKHYFWHMLENRPAMYTSHHNNLSWRLFRYIT